MGELSLMKKPGKPTKAQCSKEVRRVLLKYQADLAKMHFSANGRSTYLSGTLVKNSGEDFKSEELLMLAQELAHHGSIKSELDNWYLGIDRISYIGKNEDKAA